MLKGKVLPYARGISCIKGVAVSDKGCDLFCDEIGRKLGIYCGALSGANIANEVALEKWSETTISYDPPDLDSEVGFDHAHVHLTLQPLSARFPLLTILLFALGGNTGAIT